MKKTLIMVLILAMVSSASAQNANMILDEIGVSRGLCVVLGDVKCQLALELAQKSELLIYVQLPHAADVETARRAADAAEFYGRRIYVEEGTLTRIHLADNLADALVAVGEATGISEAEVLRVLRPGGNALLGQKELTKPFPEGVDDWSHPYHGPDNNPQSRDRLARAPYLTQFLAEPRYAPMPQVAVASAGRVFKAFGHLAFKTREEPLLNSLVAFNGYNGTMLWKRDLTPGIMVHRNTMIATPTILYVGDDKSCKLINTVTGRLEDEIIPPVEIAGGTFWKWMGLENGVLYALIGEQEQKDSVIRQRRRQHGWPWKPLSKGFNQPDNPWGFGRTIVAINPKTKEVLWHYRENEPADSRAVCMKNGQIYLFRFGVFLTCLDAKTGSIIWRKTPENAPELFKSLGKYLNRQDYQTNWRTTVYLKCSDRALYFSGPQIGKLLAVSAKDGGILWENPYDNFQLVLRDDGLYGIGGQTERTTVSKKFDPLTGKVLAEPKINRRACTRPTGSVDAIFFRASGGTVRLDVASNRPEWISPMRPPCHDGVTIANGLLYWWPSVCDCQLTLYGITCLGPAGDFNFTPEATEAERLEKRSANLLKATSLFEMSTDWSTFRKDNRGSVTTDAAISETGRLIWQFSPNKLDAAGTNILGYEHYSITTAPVTANGFVFFSGSDGVVRALDAATGKVQWTAYTGGAVRFPPTIWNGAALIGSGDGWVYSFKAETGRLLWRFRAAPAERKIPVYGSLLSTWPAASGILVEDGIAYVAAGIVNYDGTYIYALDAKTGKIKWQNNTSGHLCPEARTGVSVQGHMLLNNGKLYLAGGTSVSPAIYDITNGKCLNDPAPLKLCQSRSARGQELFLIGDKVVAGGQPFYAHPKYKVFDNSVFRKMLVASNGNRDVIWLNNRRVMCFPRIGRESLNSCVADSSKQHWFSFVWGKFDIPNLNPFWEYNCEESVALAVCRNAVVIAEESEIAVLNLQDGKRLWTQPLECPPVPWGLAVAHNGRIIVTLEDGRVLCLGGKPTTPTPYVSSEKYFVHLTKIALVCEPKGADIRYTTDGGEPTQKSKLYTKPFAVNETTIVKMRTFKKNTAQSHVVTEKIKRINYQNATETGNVKRGLLYNYYEGVCVSVSDLAMFQPLKSGIKSNFNLILPKKEEVERFGFEFSGYINIPKDGIYTFYIESNDGSRLYLDGKEVINNDGDHPAIEKSSTVALKAGNHPIGVKYYQAGANKCLKVSWKSPEIEKQEIPAGILFHKAGK